MAIRLYINKGWKEISLKELTREEAKKLKYAGTSCEEQRQCVPLAAPKRKGKSKSFVLHVAKLLGADTVHTYDDCLSSLHFRAHRNLQNSGHSLEDIAGYVVLTKEELEEFRQPDMRGNLYGAHYYFKPGKG